MERRCQNYRYTPLKPQRTVAGDTFLERTRGFKDLVVDVREVVRETLLIVCCSVSVRGGREHCRQRLLTASPSTPTRRQVRGLTRRGSRGSSKSTRTNSPAGSTMNQRIERVLIHTRFFFYALPQQGKAGHTHHTCTHTTQFGEQDSTPLSTNNA